MLRIPLHTMYHDTILITFRHQQFDPEVRRRTNRRGWTECRIAYASGLTKPLIRMAWIGRAECSKKDPFIKSTGRVLALQRALEALDPLAPLAQIDEDHNLLQMITAVCKKQGMLTDPIETRKKERESYYLLMKTTRGGVNADPSGSRTTT